MKTVAYELAEEISGRSLVAQVNRMISEGWEPLGGVSYGKSPGGMPRFQQAMVKVEDDERIDVGRAPG
jgi:hypothetical protein